MWTLTSWRVCKAQILCDSARYMCALAHAGGIASAARVRYFLRARRGGLVGQLTQRLEFPSVAARWHTTFITIIQWPSFLMALPSCHPRCNRSLQLKWDFSHLQPATVQMLFYRWGTPVKGNPLRPLANSFLTLNQIDQAWQRWTTRATIDKTSGVFAELCSLFRASKPKHHSLENPTEAILPTFLLSHLRFRGVHNSTSGSKLAYGWKIASSLQAIVGDLKEMEKGSRKGADIEKERGNEKRGRCRGNRRRVEWGGADGESKRAVQFW